MVHDGFVFCCLLQITNIKNVNNHQEKNKTRDSMRNAFLLLKTGRFVSWLPDFLVAVQAFIYRILVRSLVVHAAFVLAILVHGTSLFLFIE
jgi:hypothetical protein